MPRFGSKFSWSNRQRFHDLVEMAGSGWQNWGALSAETRGNQLGACRENEYLLKPAQAITDASVF
jgi:hypothetical protein